MTTATVTVNSSTSHIFDKEKCVNMCPPKLISVRLSYFAMVF